jgi:hypothetical protein
MSLATSPRRLALALCLATLAAAMPAAALGRAPQPLVELEVLDRDRSEWMPQYRHRGDAWIAGTPGHRYSVRLTNTTGERVLVVLSVDGVNALTGNTAAPSQAGYVLAPWQSTEVAGWRKSMDDVAQFVFTDLPDSYAARTGRPDNVGVIGIAVFRERVASPPPPPPPVTVSGSRVREQAAGKAAAPASAASADRAMAESAPQRLGTGHGQREWAPVRRTAFQRLHAHPQQVSELRYDDAGRLAALGVLPWTRRPVAPEAPRAFPGGFVPDPPRGW